MTLSIEPLNEVQHLVRADGRVLGVVESPHAAQTWLEAMQRGPARNDFPRGRWAASETDTNTNPKTK